MISTTLPPSAPGQTRGLTAFEYLSIQVDRELEPLYKDTYRSFGWSPEPTPAVRGRWRLNTTRLRFRRDRRLRNRMVINELQRTAEESLAAIHALERSRSTTPHIAAASAGILGSGFLAGSVFAITAGMWLLAIPLGAIGLFGWLVGYIAHGRVKRTTAARTAPEIARHYETLYGACEQADRLVV